MENETGGPEDADVISVAVDNDKTFSLPVEKLRQLKQKQKEVLERTEALSASGQVDSEDFQKPITI